MACHYFIQHKATLEISLQLAILLWSRRLNNVPKFYNYNHCGEIKLKRQTWTPNLILIKNAVHLQGQTLLQTDRGSDTLSLSLSPLFSLHFNFILSFNFLLPQSSIVNILAAETPPLEIAYETSDLLVFHFHLMFTI